MNQERLLKVIVSSYVSEKVTTATRTANVCAFKVLRDATKVEVKDAVEFLFNTKVKSVTVVNVKPKVKMFKGREGNRKAWKKAYVSFQSDQKIDISGVA